MNFLNSFLYLVGQICVTGIVIWDLLHYAYRSTPYNNVATFSTDELKCATGASPASIN